MLTGVRLSFYIPIYFLDFYICMLFYILLELENDPPEVETSFVFIADVYAKMPCKSLRNLFFFIFVIFICSHTE